MMAFLDSVYLDGTAQAPEKKIGLGTAALLLTIAFVFDVAQWLVTLIPLVGLLLSPVITAVAWLWFGIWFGLLGASVSRYSPGTYFGMLVFEFVPIINLIPGTTLMVWLSIRKANRGTV